MKIRNKILAGAIASSMIGLAACGGGDKGTQDVGTNGNSGSSNPSSRVFSARAIDGYLAGASVYVDQNANGKLDAFEPRALTDNDGYFSYNHRTQTDYCATGGLTQHCLRGAIGANEEVVIRVTGGYDTVTQLPFEGVLSLRASDLNRDDLRLVTPVTSLVADSSQNVQSKIDALIASGVLQPGGSLHDDPFESAEHITRAQLLAIISRVTGEIAEQTLPAAQFEDVNSSVWSSSYVAAATKLVEGIGNGGTFASTYIDVGLLEDIARRSIFSAINPAQVVPSDFQLPNRGSYQQLLLDTALIIEVNEVALEKLQGTANEEQIKALLRLQALLTERAFNNPHDAQIENALTWARLQMDQGNGLGTDLTQLGGDNIDLSKLIAPDYTFDPYSNSISASAKIPAGAATAFAALVNTAFDVSVDKEDEQGDAMFFLTGDANARSGAIKVCVRYRSDDGDFDTTSSTDPNGALLIGGRWSLLSDHTLTLNVDVAGGVRSLLLKAVGSSNSGLDYRFDFGDDLSDWHGSLPSAFAPSAVPTNDATCKAALIERFGQL